jgi:2-haloacid dehalogenase
VRPPQRSTVVFDLGGVLIQWNPRFLYRQLFAGSEQEMERFLAEICTEQWNERQDAGRTFGDGAAELIALHPDKSALIRAFGDRFDEMIPGALDDVVDILAELKKRQTPLYALTNWSAETFPSQLRRFPFLSWFDGIVVSGEERLMKPDHRFFRRLLERYDIDASRAIFIDDVLDNVQSAAVLGFHGIHFRSADMLKAELRSLELL